MIFSSQFQFLLSYHRVWLSSCYSRALNSVSERSPEIRAVQCYNIYSDKSINGQNLSSFRGEGAENEIMNVRKLYIIMTSFPSIRVYIEIASYMYTANKKYN